MFSVLSFSTAPSFLLRGKHYPQFCVFSCLAFALLFDLTLCISMQYPACSKCFWILFYVSESLILYLLIWDFIPLFWHGVASCTSYWNSFIFSYSVHCIPISLLEILEVVYCLFLCFSFTLLFPYFTLLFFPLTQIKIKYPCRKNLRTYKLQTLLLWPKYMTRAP